MKPSVKKLLRRSSLWGLGGLGLAALLSAQGPTAWPEGIQLKVVSAKVMTNEERRQLAGDSLGKDVVVTLRVSTSVHGIYLYTLRETLTPLGYPVHWTGEKLGWPMQGREGKDFHNSPGIEKLGFPGMWIFMSPGSALEWQMLDSTSKQGERHGYTIFIRQTSNGKLNEIVSESFLVPSR